MLVSPVRLALVMPCTRCAVVRHCPAAHTGLSLRQPLELSAKLDHPTRVWSSLVWFRMIKSGAQLQWLPK